MITEQDRMPISTYDTVDPVYVDEDAGLRRDENREARYFTLHLRCADDLESVQFVADVLLGTGAEVLTGDYTGGDSFHEWCEPYDREKGEENGQPGRALHVYLDAGNTEAAITASQELCRRLAARGMTQYLDSVNVTLSLAEDWAEQDEVWS